MKGPTILCLMILLPCVANGAAARPGPATVTDIRKVDFLNLTYPSALCSKEYGKEGIGKSVRVRDGEFKSKNSYFGILGDEILYADLNGDGRQDAIVPAECGSVGANYSLSEIYVYTVEKGSARLLAQISDKELERDYRRHYPDAESYWGLAVDGLKTKDGRIIVDVLVDGSHAVPKYIATLEYGLKGGALRLLGKPQRKNAEQ